MSAGAAADSGCASCDPTIGECENCWGKRIALERIELQAEVARLKKLLTELRLHLPDTEAVREIRMLTNNALGDLSAGIIWTPVTDNGRLPQWEAHIGKRHLTVTKHRRNKYAPDRLYSWYCEMNDGLTQLYGDTATEAEAKAAAIAAALGTV